jgi:hypothetical protein
MRHSDAEAQTETMAVVRRLLATLMERDILSMGEADTILAGPQPQQQARIVANTKKMSDAEVAFWNSVDDEENHMTTPEASDKPVDPAFTAWAMAQPKWTDKDWQEWERRF